MIGNTLANDCQSRTRRANCVEASQNLVKRAVDRDPLEMRELPTSKAEMRVHEHVRLKRTAEAALTPASPASEGRDLAVVLG